MWIALLIVLVSLGSAGIVARALYSKGAGEGNPADAFDIIEDV